jgi:surfeit locus 1 family protein
MYSFLRRPAWVVSHVLVATLVVVLISLGLWQRARYAEETAEADRIERMAGAEPAEFDAVVRSGVGIEEAEATLRQRRVVLRGTYDPAGAVTIRNRSLGGAPGVWVLTPLVREDGPAVAVVRGWVPWSGGELEDLPPEATPPAGAVVVTGTLQPSQERGSIGPADPPQGRLGSLARVDVERLESQLDYELSPVWVLLDDQSPPQAEGLPTVVVQQFGDPSQNLSYMFQWWIFALIAIVGYPLVLRSVARSRAQRQAPPEPDDSSADVDGLSGVVTERRR